MSSSSKEKSGKKKKDVWQEAGGEFYQEQYPCGSGQAASSDNNVNETTQRRVPRPHIPLPSQTARRNTFIPTGPGRKYSRKYSLTATATATINATNCMTYSSTMAGVANGNDVHIALMPDLADETIPNEKVTHEAIQKIRILTESMGLKRLRKAKISAIPKLRLHGWRRLKWDFRKGMESIRFFWTHRIYPIALFQNSLQKIEVRGGTSIVNVFLFIKWTMFLNIAMSLAIALFIFVPFVTTPSPSKLPGGECTNPNFAKEDQPYNSKKDLRECCTKSFSLSNDTSGERGSLALMAKIIFRVKNDSLIEKTPFFYGYYMMDHIHKIDWFAVSYALTFTGIMMFSFLIMVRSIGQGIQELVQAGEGEFYKYSNLIFAGWDHYTKDDKGALFKRKILHHEMRLALQTEKRNLESLIRSRKERLKLGLTRFGVNVLVIVFIILAGYTIFEISSMSLKPHKKNADVTKLEKLAYGFAPSILISFYNLIFPIILGKLGKYEKYSGETETALLLMRAVCVRLMAVGFAAYRYYEIAYCTPISGPTSENANQKFYCVKCKHDKHPSRRPCWESLFADQVYKLILVDLLFKLIITFFIDPLRVKMKNVCKSNFCRKIGTLKFNIVRHSLDLIYIQVLSWLGMYFGPFIPMVAVIYCLLAFYIKKYSVLYNCTAVPDTFKTIRTTTIYVAAKLVSFIVVALTNVAVIGYMTPSWECGPFRDFTHPWEAVMELIKVYPEIVQVYEGITSPGLTVPVTILLVLLLYYYYSVAQANRGMVDTMRHLLILEGHDKQYLFARLNSLRRTDVDRSDSTLQRDP